MIDLLRLRNFTFLADNHVNRDRNDVFLFAWQEIMLIWGILDEYESYEMVSRARSGFIKSLS